MNADRLKFIGLAMLLASLSVSGILALLNGEPVRAAAGVLYVAPGGSCGGANPCFSSIQAAVDAALPNDEIRVAAGTYPLTAGMDQLVLVAKALTIRGGFTTGNWTTPNPEVNATVLNALGQGRVMVISGAAPVTIEGLQMVYGNADGFGGANGGDDAGGALYINGADVTLRQTWLMTSTTPSDGSGGGLYGLGNSNSLVMIDCLVQGNYAENGGGVFLYEFSSTLKNNTIRDNNNEDFGFGGGLRIYNGNATLSGNLIANNDGGAGAGLAVLGADIHLDHNTIQDNATWSNGGGLLISKSTAVLEYNLIQGNSSQLGGGLNVTQSTLTMLYNTVSLNDAKRSGAMEGGGINLSTYSGGPALIYGNLFQSNQASYGGGLRISGDQPSKIEGNLFLDNQAWDDSCFAAAGGLYVNASNLQINRNLIQRNSASQGDNPLCNAGAGGLAIYSDVTLKNNIITDNGVSGDKSYAPGVYVYGANPDIYHNTIANNQGAEGSGVYVTQAGTDGEAGRPVLYNTLIANQMVGVYVNPSSLQNLATIFGVLWWNNVSNTDGTVFAFDEISGDPLFVDTAGFDYHLSAGSAAINQSPASWVPLDFDGEPRLDTPDLGADEYWVPGELKLIYIPLVRR